MRGILLFSILCTLSWSVLAQNKNAVDNNLCEDKAVHSKLVNLNQDLEQNNNKLLLFNVLNLQSKAYAPVVVHLEQGQSYIINYVASSSATRYEIMFVDKSQRELFKHSVKSLEPSDYVYSNTITAPYSGNYALIINQKTKGAGCAGVSIFKKAK